MLEVFKGIVQMAFNCYVAGLKFDGDFKLGNILFQRKDTDLVYDRRGRVCCDQS